MAGIVRTAAHRIHPRVMTRVAQFIEETGSAQFPMEAAGAVETEITTSGITETGSAQMPWSAGGVTELCSASNTTVFGTGVTAIEGYIGSGDYAQIYPPGSCLEITAGNRTRLRISNVQGTKELPIVIKNSSGGAVVLTSTTQTQILLRNCHHIHFDGTGAAGVTYGFQATAAVAGKSFEILFRSGDVEVNNVEMANANGIMFRVHTNKDSSYDYQDGPGTPSTFTGANAWVDTTFRVHDLKWHDGGAEGCYIGNNHAKRDNEPDMDDFAMWDCIGDTTDLEVFDFKTMTNGQCTDCTSEGGGVAMNPGSDAGLHLGVGAGITVLRHTDTAPNGNNFRLGHSWRHATLRDCVGINAGADALRIVPNSPEEEDGGSTLIDNLTTTNPANSAIDTNVGNATAAAASLIKDSELEHAAANACIEHDDQSIPESNNVCSPI